jgi:hypothetical protein
MTEMTKPLSGAHLAELLECDWSEGVVVAVLPEVIEEITTKEIPFTDRADEYMHVLLCLTEAWGQRAMDVVAPNEEKVKWWKAKAMMVDQKLDLIPIRWEGPISEIPQMYFDRDYVLAIRFYDSGPWFFPKEQPTLKTDAVEDAATGTDEPAGG